MNLPREFVQCCGGGGAFRIIFINKLRLSFQLNKLKYQCEENGRVDELIGFCVYNKTKTLKEHCGSSISVSNTFKVMLAFDNTEAAPNQRMTTEQYFDWQ